MGKLARREFLAAAAGATLLGSAKPHRTGSATTLRALRRLHEEYKRRFLDRGGKAGYCGLGVPLYPSWRFDPWVTGVDLLSTDLSSAFASRGELQPVRDAAAEVGLPYTDTYVLFPDGVCAICLPEPLDGVTRVQFGYALTLIGAAGTAWSRLLNIRVAPLDETKGVPLREPFAHLFPFRTGPFRRAGLLGVKADDVYYVPGYVYRAAWPR